MPRVRYVALFLLIAIVGMGARIFHMHTPEGSDDAMFRVAATELFAPHIAKLLPVFYNRMGVGAILRIWFSLFGMGLYVTAPLLLLLSLTNLLLFTTACRLMMDKKATLIAAAFYWLHPIAIQFDGVLEADEFAVPFLLASFVFFLLHVTRRRLVYLFAAGVFAGLLFFLKEYYILIALPFAAAILRDADQRYGRFSRLAALAAGIICVLAADPVLSYLNSGSATAHLFPLVEYGDARTVWEHEPEHLSLKQAASLLVERGVYLEYLLQDFGVAGGVALISGWVYLFVKRRETPYFVALTAATVFFAFLSFTLVKLRPMIFVEAQPRYALVLLPFLAFGAGPPVACFLSSVADVAVRKVGHFALVLVCGLNCCVPNSRIDRVRTLECKALMQLMNGETARGATTIVCPQNYRTLILDQMIAPGFTLKYANKRQHPVNWHEFGDIPDELLTAPATGFFVPVRSIERAPAPVAGENRPVTADDVPDPRPALAAAGYEAYELRVPNTSTRVWLARLGVPLKGKVVGWFYIRGNAEK